MAKCIQFFLSLLLAITLFVVVCEGPSSASVGTRPEKMHANLQEGELSQKSRDRDLKRIIGVLECRIQDHRLAEKAKNKLAAMNNDEVRLVLSLCDRITETGNTAGADFALLLVTAMIVLS